MVFAKMKLEGSVVKTNFIFGVLNKGDLVRLPQISGGHWVDEGEIDERHFDYAAEAKVAILAFGYFLFGSDAISGYY